MFGLVYWWVLVLALSPCYILVCVFWGWCIDGFGVFHASKIPMCLGLRLDWGWGLHRRTGLGPLVGCFTSCSGAMLLLWIFCVFFCLVFAVPLSILMVTLMYTYLKPVYYCHSEQTYKLIDLLTWLCYSINYKLHM